MGMHYPNLSGCFEGPSTVQFYDETNLSSEWNIFIWSFSYLLLIHSRRVAVSYKKKYLQEVLLNYNRLCKLAQEKCVAR